MNRRRRGQPAYAFGGLLVMWLVLRVMTWEPLADPVVAVKYPDKVVAPMAQGSRALGRSLAPAICPACSPRRGARLARPVSVRHRPGLALATARRARTLHPPPALSGVAILAAAPSPGLPAPAVAPALMPVSVPAPVPDTPSSPRFSADAWLLARSGGGGGVLAAGLPVYGASQLGAVLRVRLGAGGLRPDAYLRGVAALNGSGERGLATGLSVRLPGLPLRLAGEARVDRFVDGRVHVRPAVTAVTEMPPLPLAKGFAAETYLQGGFVGGAAATPFIDGQLRVERGLARHGPVAVRVGAGAWGGAERGSGRLDLGPAASVRVGSGPAAMRLAIDWRLRVAGAAAPGSGPTLTLAASF